MNLSTLFRLLLTGLFAVGLGGVRVAAQDAATVHDDAKVVETASEPKRPNSDKPDADARMPDISGKWQIKVEFTTTTEAGQPVSVTPQTFVFRRVHEATADYVITSNADEKGSMTTAKWSAETKRFEAKTIYADDPKKAPNSYSLRLLEDGQSMELAIHVDPDKKMKLLDEEGWTEEAIEKFSKHKLVRVLDQPAAIAPPKPAAQPMPDISGKWRMGKDGEQGIATITPDKESDGFVIKESKNAGAPDKVNWSAADHNFGGGYVFKGPAWRDLELQADDKTLRVTITLPEEVKDRILKRGELTEAGLEAATKQEWTRVDPKDADEPIPDISGTWKSKPGLSPEVAWFVVKRVEGTQSEFVGRFKTEPIQMKVDVCRLKWVPATRCFEGTMQVPEAGISGPVATTMTLSSTPVTNWK
jgi:hypothetical protein